MKIKVIFDKVSQLAWIVRLVETGERYGRDDCLTHEKEEPLVEFFDARHPHTDLGQFVQRYSASTLISSSTERDLCMEGGVPDWVLHAEAFAQVTAWLKENVVAQFHKDPFTLNTRHLR